MKEVNISLLGFRNLNNMGILIDGKAIKLKKNQFNNLTTNFKTDKDKVKIEIYKYLDVGGAGWFITKLFFFLISIFGILDVYQKNNSMGAACVFEIELQDKNDIRISCNPPKENEKAFVIQTDLNYTEIENIYYLDKKAKKKLKALTFAKILLAILVILTVILVVVL